ncbi:hypothetical protein BpHYR1_000782 [Brachionus plicatilis]|uniref:CCHC-type domain-containing protein n=1 Tax=Brachionus plicatilis TaxID=10195 RepID=A0A3M7QMU3_BRAPC|nr:hypothetical protein BpHYR1_000782 [Brachionus plicatilis]
MNKAQTTEEKANMFNKFFTSIEPSFKTSENDSNDERIKTPNSNKSLVCRNCKNVGHTAKEYRSKKNGTKSNDNKTPIGNYKQHASNNYN